MLYLALKNFLYRPARLLLTLLAIAAILAEILVLEGFMAGSYQQLRQTVLQRGGDVMVSQTGISNFLAARSVLPQKTRAAVEAVEGVKTTHPLTVIMQIYEAKGRLGPIIIMVYDAYGGGNSGGPVNIIEGKPPTGSGEMVIDQALSKRYDLHPGDILTLSDYDFTVSGISANSAALFTPFAFITYDSLIDFYFESDIADDISAFPLLSFLSVETKDGADPLKVAQRISKEVPEADAMLPKSIADNDENMGRALMGPVLNLLLWLSYIIGALAIGMFMFAAVRSQQRNFGVLRALGFTSRDLIIGVIAEAVVITLLALPPAILLAVFLAALIEIYAPVYLVLAAEPAAIIRTGLIAILLAVTGALAPLQILRRLDPATAFQEA